MGVDFAAEARVVNFFRRLSEGRLPGGGDEVLIGQAMARNLGASVGDELLMLGTAREGGVAALALTISGAFDSGIDELDRTVVFTSLPNLQNAFDLGDELHTIVLKFDDFGQLAARTSALQAALPGDLRVRSWRETMPELVQAIQLDRVSAQFMYGAILILVTFSVINTFIMVVFERTREFGMLLAIGMRPLLIMLQVQAEVFFLWLLGAAVGLGLLVLLVGYVASVGIPISGLEDIARQMYVFDRLYPSFSFMGLMSAPLILLVGTQLAVLVATSRVHRLRPVAALRVN
jgi:ABC-type lipoprotein release transport system permease subunit